jgi:hypothetical protein
MTSLQIFLMTDPWSARSSLTIESTTGQLGPGA